MAEPKAPNRPPMPRPTRTSAPYWQAIREHRLDLPWCPRCGDWVFYPRPFCPRCLHPDLEWRTVSGRGTVYTYTVIRRAVSPYYMDKTPYVHAIVELEEGPRLVTNIVNCAPEEVHIGMPVRAVFQDWEEGTLVFFEPRRAE